MVKSKNHKKLPPLEYLRSILSYDPVSGHLTWCAPRSNISVGSRAGRVHNKGYRRVTIDGTSYLEHRVAFALGHNVREFGILDHKNGDRSDNRLTNLREATRQENNRNSLIRIDNTSGYKGVYFHRRAGSYLAKIQVNRRGIYLGLFDCPREAAQVYDDAALRYHGEFAKTNAAMGLL